MVMNKFNKQIYKFTTFYLFIFLLIISFLYSPKARAEIFPLSTQFTTNTPEVVVTNAQRLAAGVNVWPDGNMGFYRFGGQNRVAAANSSNIASTTSTPANFLSSVVSSSIAISSLKEAANYASGGPIYNDIANNRLLMFYHAENNTVGGFWSSIGMAVSTDGGTSWTDLGRIIKPNLAVNSPNNLRSVEVMGAPYMVKDGYFYVYFKDTLDSGTIGGQSLNLTVARASVADVLSAANTGGVANFQKYYQSSFSQPGLGGLSQNIAVGYPFMRWCDVIYLPQISRYALVFTSEINASTFMMSLGTSQDGVSWYPSARITDYTAGRELIYLTASSDNYSDPRVATGNQFYIYRTNSVISDNRWSDTYVEKFTVNFTDNPSPSSSSSSSGSNTLAATGRSQVYMAIIASAVISITVLLAAYAVSKLNYKK